MTYDYAMEESTGVVLAHRANCKLVRALADAGEPVATLMGCKAELPADFPRHECLNEGDPGPVDDTLKVVEGEHRTAHVAS